jgi:uncharacterized OsmC-like protein
MTSLNEYLRYKREAVRQLADRVRRPGYEPLAIRARVTAEGRSGVRRIRLRDHQVLSDSPPEFVGYDLGPSSPELALGALGSCLTHSYLIQASAAGLELDSLEVDVTGRLDQRAGASGFEDAPREPHGIAYTVRLETRASDEEIAELHEAVERFCPLLNLVRQPQTVVGTVQRIGPRSEDPTARSLSPAGVGR